MKRRKKNIVFRHGETKVSPCFKMGGIFYNENVFLLADKNLDCRCYNISRTGTAWETCTLRSWLNGYDNTKNNKGIDYIADNFLRNAFSTAEQKVIKNTNVVNMNNPIYDTKGGKTTIDKVFLYPLRRHRTLPMDLIIHTLKALTPVWF